MKPISKVASFVAQPGAEKQLGEALQALIVPTLTEQGVRRYEVLQDMADPRRWIVQEDWRSVQDFDLHMATPYVSTFLSIVPQLCLQAPEIRSYEKRGPRSSTPEAGHESR